jgi:hypothetical protein
MCGFLGLPAATRTAGTPVLDRRWMNRNLLGTKLPEDYTAYGGGIRKGTVFAPEMRQRFASRIGLICKSQVWDRVDRLSNA